MQEPMEVAPDIFRVTQELNFKQMKFMVNIYVLPGENGLVFDSGFGNRKAGRSLVGSILRITETVRHRGQPCTITKAMASHGHWDHFSGLAYLQKALNVQILATPKQAPKIQSKQAYKKLFWAKPELVRRPASNIARRSRALLSGMTKNLYMSLLRIKFVPENPAIIDHGTKFSIGKQTWELIHLPGHCDDDAVLYNQEEGIALTGDLVLNSINTWLGPPSSRLDHYIEALEFLKKLPNLNLILPAHGSPITAPRKRLQEAIDHRRKRTRDMFQLILDSGNHGISFGEIFKHYYPKSRRILGNTLRGWIIVTLEHLLDQGEIISTPKGRDIFFTNANAPLNR